MRRRAATLASAAILAALTGCGAEQPPGGSVPWEAAGPGREVAEAAGRVVPADAAGEAFDGGAAFLTADTGGSRTWVHVEHGSLRLVERGDGGIDAVPAVADVDVDAAAWHDVDRVDVEVVFGGQRCG